MISLHQGQNERVLMKKLEMWRQDAQSVNMDHKWTIQKTFTHTNKNCQIIYCRQSFGLSCKRWKINFSPLFPFFSILVYLFYFFFCLKWGAPPLSGILGFRSGVCIPYTHSFGTDTHTHDVSAPWRKFKWPFLQRWQYPIGKTMRNYHN